ncbi:hypothetical protein HQ47_06970 [Porphyromonas macacae]|uniref:Uncharacterized protein n=1 Tax=Porphyromonas macacae TaxID=28115 RepID=A0A0A2EB70_9PORP|nr:hypothetical protein HQ47_06970 [Porphyromonas macacae]
MLGKESTKISNTFYIVMVICRMAMWIFDDMVCLCTFAPYSLWLPEPISFPFLVFYVYKIVLCKPKIQRFGTMQ